MLNFSTYAIKDKDIIDNSGLMFLKFLSSIDVKIVYIAGMDGYSQEKNYFDTTLDYEFNHLDERNRLIKKNIIELSKSLEIKFITPSIYEVSE